MVWWCIVFCAIAFIGVTKSGFGSGVGLMIVPMTAIAMGHIPGRGSEAALGLLLPLLIVGDLIAVWQYRRLFFLQRLPVLAAIPAGGAEPDPQPPHAAEEARRLIRRLMPGTAVGVVLGGTLLWLFHQKAS